ncbi:hypothetical protein IW138_005076 [Coemansia sp. RSA 986]|nr:hypothetical protein IW138_005076 [Coemansia sp. RSA 986]
MMSAASDKRIATITELLQGIKAVKLFGWESRFLEKVDERREHQLDYSWKVFLWSTGINAVAFLNPIITLAIMFTSYVVVFGNTLNAEVAFTSIAVFEIVRTALRRIPVNINKGIGGYVALKRIDSFLRQPQVQDLEERTSAQVFSDELGFDCADLEWNSPETTKDTVKIDSIATKSTDSAADSNQTTEITPLLAGISQIQTTLSARSSATNITDQEGVARFSLKDVDVRFPRGDLSIVAGPTGSGKSSLLSALVGEMTLVRGRVLLPTIDSSTLADDNEKYRDIIELSSEGLAIRDIAYIAQESWLRNSTIRENILFGEPYDQERYEEVLRVCALKPDLRILVAGDMTEIGERGVTLSGGQKQRVALARAVYSSRRILLTDDCLSAVDAHTARHILMECLLSKTKLMQGRTRVLVTHHVAMCLPYAQYMVMMHEDQITLKGTPAELKNKSTLSLALLESQGDKDDSNADKQRNEASSASKGKGISSNIEQDSDDSTTNAVNDTKPEGEYNKEHLRKLAEKRGIDPNSDLSVLQGILIKDEEREEGYVKLEVWKTTSRELKRLESNSMSPLLSLFGELIQGATTIRAFGAKHYYIKEAINRISAHNRTFYTVWAANRWLNIRVDAVSAMISATTAAFVLFNLDWVDAGMAGFILSYTMAFTDNMVGVVRDHSTNEMNMNSIERIMQYLKVEQEAALESDPGNNPSALWPRKGDVQIEDLVVEYVPGVPVLHDVSLSAKHGEKVGVVGRTGAGKSTMSLALLRFIEASKGRIVLDGVDISKIGLEDLRRNVTIIPQDPVLFNGTIRFNLDPFDEHPDELLWDALKRTHLVRERGSQTASTAAGVAEDANDGAPMLEHMAGIFTSPDAEIKENGQSLSKLIVMDEATASVDFDTDGRIQRTIRGPEFANSTLFCVAHRLRTIIDYDRVLVLDKGKVIEFGTPCSLLQNENGIFRSMCEKSAVPASDKALHFVGFGVMAVLVFFSFQATVPRRKAWALTGASMAVVCLFSEVLQWMLTTRAFEWSDIVCNFLGASMFLFAAWMADRWIIQPRVGSNGGLGTQYRDSTRYWVLNSRGDGSPRESLGEDDDLDVELDEILVDSPPQTARGMHSASPSSGQ